MGKGFFDIPMNLPHAGTVASRLVYHVQRVEQVQKKKFPDALKAAEALESLLDDCRFAGENPEDSEAQRLAEAAAELARKFVDAVDAAQCGDDRLGQAVRNLFECIGLGREGAQQSLRAGENPNSTLRPT